MIFKIILGKIMRRLHVLAAVYAGRNWDRLSSSHFTVYYRQDEDAASLVLHAAEEIYYKVGRFFEVYPRERIHIFLYPHREELDDLFGWTDVESVGVYWAGIIHLVSPRQQPDSGAGTGEASSSRFPAAETLAHEYTHLLIDMLSGGNHPRWLTEGLALCVEKKLGSELQLAGCSGWQEEYVQEQKFDQASTQLRAYSQALAMADALIKGLGWSAVVYSLKLLGRGWKLEQALQALPEKDNGLAFPG